MPIKKDIKRLKQLIDHALLYEDIKDSIKKYNLSSDGLIEKVHTKGKEVWNEGATIETELEKLEKEKPKRAFSARRRFDFYEREKKFQEEFDKIVIEKGILPLLREIINNDLKPSYEFKLLKFKSTGLSEIFNPSYEIETFSKKRLLFMLNNMPGGSIGIAGSRGAGKSTLIRSICTSSNLNIKGKRIFSVMTSAPVEYGARDFMLHIFAMVCKKILAEFDPESQGVLGHYLQEFRRPFWERILILFKRIRTFSILLGIVFLILSPFLKGIEDRNSILGSEKAETAEVNNFNQKKKVSEPIKAAKNTNTVFQILNQFTRNILIELKQNTSKFTNWGFILIIFGGSLTILIFPIPTGKMRQKGTQTQDFLVEQAKEAIREIKFQQTYTTGWIGSLKFPLEVSGGIEGAVSLAQKQLSLPEIVDAFLNFLRNISKEYKIIIGIDELDKLESDEKALLFINEVKAIFGVEDCFYLISVSESAMCNFERRGLPFRDSFDSAFDDVLHVNYLSLEEASRLLWRRVVGTPVPFICLCYSISGGLAREIIRVYRDIFELIELNPEANTLDGLSKALLKSEMMIKIKATMIAVKKIDLIELVTKFLSNLMELELSLKSIDDFRSKFLELAQILLIGQDYSSYNKKMKVEVVRLNSLGQDLVTYLYYCLTLVDFFCERLNEKVLVSAITEGFIDKLAKARQFQTVNYYMSLLLTNEFRRKYQLDIFVDLNQRII